MLLEVLLPKSASKNNNNADIPITYSPTNVSMANAKKYNISCFIIHQIILYMYNHWYPIDLMGENHPIHRCLSHVCF